MAQDGTEIFLRASRGTPHRFGGRAVESQRRSDRIGPISLTKRKIEEEQENWEEYARRSGKRCSFCGCVLTYDEYNPFGHLCSACDGIVNSGD